MILTAVRWSASYPLSATHVMQLLAERHIDVSARTVLNWVQPFGPQLAKALSSHRRRWGRRWDVDEVFCFRGRHKRYLYRAVDQHGQGIDILLRDKRDRASAEAFFRHALSRTGRTPHTVVSDHHRPYLKAVARMVPLGQRFLECFEGLHAVRRGDVKLRALVPGYQPTTASPHETTRAVMVALNVVGAQLQKAA